MSVRESFAQYAKALKSLREEESRLTSELGMPSIYAKKKRMAKPSSDELKNVLDSGDDSLIKDTETIVAQLSRFLANRALILSGPGQSAYLLGEETEGSERPSFVYSHDTTAWKIVDTMFRAGTKKGLEEVVGGVCGPLYAAPEAARSSQQSSPVNSPPQIAGRTDAADIPHTSAGKNDFSFSLPPGGHSDDERSSASGHSKQARRTLPLALPVSPVALGLSSQRRVHPRTMPVVDSTSAKPAASGSNTSSPDAQADDIATGYCAHKGNPFLRTLDPELKAPDVEPAGSLDLSAGGSGTGMVTPARIRQLSTSVKDQLQLSQYANLKSLQDRIEASKCLRAKHDGLMTRMKAYRGLAKEDYDMREAEREDIRASVNQNLRTAAGRRSIGTGAKKAAVETQTDQVKPFRAMDSEEYRERYALAERKRIDQEHREETEAVVDGIDYNLSLLLTNQLKLAAAVKELNLSGCDLGRLKIGEHKDE